MKRGDAKPRPSRHRIALLLFEIIAVFFLHLALERRAAFLYPQLERAIAAKDLHDLFRDTLKDIY